ncbi:hemerythrin family protein [Clostridium sp. JN-1]|uniref:bacteriohemerythrin n=1 Tax=Clostridium sp. JN-1 TaxID=2483110 RepID=UPI000F0BCA8B|nr:hemerythrin family protein [Clostridium sp. JN-1]
MTGLFTDRLLICVDKIDEQHIKLFKAIDKFQQACNDRKCDEVIGLFNFLKVCFEKHFKDEEGYMVKYIYPEYDEHMEEHNFFLRKIYAFDIGIKGGYISITKMMEMNEFFTENFVMHLSEVDSKLGEFLKDKL